jgi:hypothetical protein
MRHKGKGYFTEEGKWGVFSRWLLHRIPMGQRVGRNGRPYSTYTYVVHKVNVEYL